MPHCGGDIAATTDGVSLYPDDSKIVPGEWRGCSGTGQRLFTCDLKNVGRIFWPLITYETNANPRLLPPDDMTREIDVVGFDQ